MEGWQTVYESGRTPLWTNPMWFRNHKAVTCSYLCWAWVAPDGSVRLDTPVVVYEVARGGKLLVMVEIDQCMVRGIWGQQYGGIGELKLAYRRKGDGTCQDERWFLEISVDLGAPSLERQLWDLLGSVLPLRSTPGSFRVYHPKMETLAQMDFPPAVRA